MATSIAINDLTCQYHRHTALRDVSLMIPLGKTTALVGGNGSGKSTLLATLAGVHKRSGGSVENLPASVAFVVQRSSAPDALPITVRQTVAMGRWAAQGTLRRFTRRDHQIVAESMQALKIDHLAPRNLSTLSGGQRQRALVAQGLAQQAHLLLLDEPLAGVDTEAEELIAGAIDRLRTRQRATIVLATHSFNQARQADHVVHLDHGAVVQEGRPQHITLLAKIGN